MKIRLLFLVVALIFCFGFSDKTKVLMEKAVSENKSQLPMEIDEETVWVDLIASDEGLTYIYKLKTLTVDTIDHDVLNEIIEENMKNNCRSKFVSIILNEGGSIAFIYRDAKGNNIITRKYKKNFAQKSNINCKGYN